MWPPLLCHFTALNHKRRAALQLALPALDYPLDPQPKVAVLGVGIRPDSLTVCLKSPTARQLLSARPAALAGAWEDLAAVGRWLASGTLSLPELIFPLVVFSDPARGVLTEQQHAWLWDWYHLPVFEQLRDPTLRLLAWECEAREGFHVCPGASLSPLESIALDAACPCGLETARLLPIPGSRARAAGA